MYARVDDPRAVVERRLARKAWQFFASGLAMVLLPVGAYLGGLFEVPWVGRVFPGGVIQPAQWLPLTGIIAVGLVFLGLALVRYRPLVRRGEQASAWVELTDWEMSHAVRVRFGYEVGGKRHVIKRWRHEAEVARYGEACRITVVYDPRRPARADVVVVIAMDDLFARLATAARISLHKLGPMLGMPGVVLAGVGLLALGWKLSGADERVKNALIPPSIFVVLGSCLVGVFWVRRRRAMRRGDTLKLSPADKLKIALVFGLAGLMAVSGVKALRKGDRVETQEVPQDRGGVRHWGEHDASGDVSERRDTSISSDGRGGRCR